MKKSRTFASLLKTRTSGVQLSWFRASALQAEGRRFESVNAHKQIKKERTKVLSFFYYTLRSQTCLGERCIIKKKKYPCISFFICLCKTPPSRDHGYPIRHHFEAKLVWIKKDITKKKKYLCISFFICLCKTPPSRDHGYPIRHHFEAKLVWVRGV